MADSIQRPAAWAGVFALALVAGVLVSDVGGMATRVRETFFDVIMRLVPPVRANDTVLVVDIDRDSLAARGQWPWRRGLLADLIGKIHAGHPAAIGLDILLRGPDRRAPRAIIETIIGETGQNELLALAKTLPDEDAHLADTLAETQTVIGLALDPGSKDAAPFPASILSKGPLPARSLRASSGVAAPLSQLSDSAAAVGILSLQAGSGDVVRDVPLFASAANEVFAGFALEVLRVADGASAFVIPDKDTLKIGDRSVPFPDDGLMRLHFSSPAAWSARTIKASDLLAGTVDAKRFTDRIVLVGSSAPEAGARLATPVDPLTPTVQIEADAIEQVRSGAFPTRVQGAETAEALAGLLIGLAAIAAALYLTPLAAAGALFVLCIGWVALAFAGFAGAGVLVDPVGPILPAFAGANVAALLMFARTRRMRVAIERKFARYVAPEVVKRLTDNPEELKIEGEIREVTALFSDIEGFTTMTESAEPRALIAALDAYFEGVCAIIIRHGGMVDKLVGDAAHGLFNAPLDVPDHARRALECAQDIDRFCEEFRRREGPKSLGFGRTRIGFETGPVIVGDVGGLGHLDYTAHGDAVNSAARLEALNKQFGTTIAIGPRAAAAIGTAVPLRPLGRVTLRGRSGASLVHTVWPDTLDEDHRRRHNEVFALVEEDANAARRHFEDLSAAHPGDVVFAYWSRTLAKS